MNNFQTSELEREIKALAQATGYWNDEAVRQFIELAVLTQDREQIKFFRELFNEVLAQDDSNYHPMLPDPDPGEVDFGDILLGTLTTGGEVRVPVNELLYNKLVVAPPRAGKTVLVTQIASHSLPATSQFISLTRRTSTRTCWRPCSAAMFWSASTRRIAASTRSTARARSPTRTGC